MGGSHGYNPPGIAGLVTLLAEHGVLVEADFQRSYGLELAAVTSWRRLKVLVFGLPAESATVRAVVGPNAEWSTVEHMLATVIDLLAAGNWQRAKRRSAPRPKLVQRPGDRAGKRLGRGAVTIDELERRFAAREAHRGG